MPFMLKIQWDIKAGRETDFRANQATLCKVMLEHPGVICLTPGQIGTRGSSEVHAFLRWRDLLGAHDCSGRAWAIARRCKGHHLPWFIVLPVPLLLIDPGKQSWTSKLLHSAGSTPRSFTPLRIESVSLGSNCVLILPHPRQFC
jgi:hypothetical protein